MAASFQAFQVVLSRIEETPWYTGTVSLNASNSGIFYLCDKENAKYIDFSKPIRQEQLDHLAGACERATFGLDQKDVLDESYRKAGKMDAERFSTQFAPAVEAAVLDKVEELLLHTNRANKHVKLELYKLNVYGPGAFFKAHVDTPRSDSMFGSLVIVLPTNHEGGSLVFRHGDRENTFDSAAAVTVPSDSALPEAAFVAFFCDVQHEVLPVISGYRITLTYNMYYDTRSMEELMDSKGHSESEMVKDLHSSLLALLDDPEFLPKGGMIGFGLSHRYPFESDASKSNLTDALKHLKGTDAMFRLVCEMAGVDVKVNAYVQDINRVERCSPYACIADRFPSFANYQQIETDLLSYLTNPPSRYYETFEGDGVVVKSVIPGIDAIPEGDHDEAYQYDWKTTPVDIVWLQNLPDERKLKTAFMAYGNEASLNHAYGNVCLVGSIPSYEDRKRGDSQKS